MAARVDPTHASAKPQALHRFVAQAQWSDDEMPRCVCPWVVPKMDLKAGGWWIIDDNGFPKKGRHSVGVARRYCGRLGRQDNGQLAVGVSLASDQGSRPVAWPLDLPEEWASDPERRRKAGVPEEVSFATKPQVALQQMRKLVAEGAPRHCVLAGAGKGRRPVMPRRTAELQPIGVKALAQSVPEQAWQMISWREDSNDTLSGRFAALGVRHAGGNAGRARLQPEQWLLVESPADQDEPLKCWPSTLPAETAPSEPIAASHHRWRIERDCQDLKQDFGLGRYEGRGWRGFHHHASLCIAAYGFPMAERLMADRPVGGKENFALRQSPALPADDVPCGSPARAAPCAEINSLAAPLSRVRTHRSTPPVPSLRARHARRASVTP